ncbi:MAG: hypothetical protein AB1649_10440 [Chloroflexota bacterium]
MRQVEIRIEGHLDESWAEWLEGFAFSHTAEGETVLTGRVKDQATLYGLITKLRDLGVKLVSVNSIQQPRRNLLQTSSAKRNQ